MFQRTIKSIFNLLNFRRTTFLILLFCICLGTIVPIFQANALEAPKISKWDVFLSRMPGLLIAKKGLETLGLGEQAANGILLAVFKAMVAVTSALLAFSQGLLNWVISPDFISVKFTDNPIVNLGWTTVRDLTNMLFILVLVIIALGSALRIKEYEVKKLLPTLILIAVLINFTPVICGFIIDASNIVMNTFLSQGLLSKGFVDTLSTEIGAVEDLGSPIEKLGGGTVLVLFNLVGTIIFLLFALLFAVRYVALWILVIFSPIAFFCYILPQTKGVWSAWWKQFTQWCIIGIIAGFFIYLTNITIAQIVENKGIVNTPSSDLNINVISNLVIYLVPILFLIIGFFVSLQSSAIGADKVMAFGKGAGKKAFGFAKGKIKETAPVKGTKEKLSGLLQKAEMYAHPTERGRLVSKAKHIEENKKEAEEQQKVYSSMSSEAIVKHAKTDSERAAMMMELIKRKKTGEIKKENLYNDMKIAFDYAGADALKDLSDQRPDLAGDIEEITKGIHLSPERKSEEIRKEVQKQQPVKFRLNTEKTPEILEDSDVFMAMTPEQFYEMGMKGSEKQKSAIMKAATGFTDEKLHEIKIKNEMTDEEYRKMLENIEKNQDIIKENQNFTSINIEREKDKKQKKLSDFDIK